MTERVVKHVANRPRLSILASPSIRPFQCQWRSCPKSFNRKSDLQRHYRIHTNERPYACDYSPCGKTFIQRSALTVHRRTHTGDKPHKCPYEGCGKCFSDSSSLARHRRIHTNDKPYICKNSQCRKAFCRKTTMTKHFRKEHPNESLEQNEEAEYSDYIDDDESDREPSLDENESATPDSTDHHRDIVNKTDGTRNAAASNYNANLWRLPAQTAQKTKRSHASICSDLSSDVSIQSVKLEYNASTNSHRTMTDSMLGSPVVSMAMLPNRADTFPEVKSRRVDTNFGAWLGQQAIESPVSAQSTQSYQHLHNTAAPTPSTPSYTQTMIFPPVQAPLDAIDDIIRAEHQHYMPDSRPTYSTRSMSTAGLPLQLGHPHQQPLPLPEISAGSPHTPTSAPQSSVAPFISQDAMLPYQAPQAVPHDEFQVEPIITLSPQPTLSQFYNTFGAYKDFKTDDIYSQMPDQITWTF